MSHLPGILPSAIASSVCLLLAAVIWKCRKLPVARAFYWVLLFIFIWVFSRFVIILLDSDGMRLLVSKLQYVGIAFLPLAWLLFSLSAIKYKQYPGRKKILLMSVVPSITVLLALSNEYHHLIWQQISFDQHRVVAEHGGWFMVHIAYSYTLIAISATLAAIEYIQHPGYKTELIAIILAPLTVLFANLNNLIGWLDFGGADTVSIAFSISSLLFFWVVLRDNYLQLVPVARAVLVENMQDAIVVLDEESHIIDANPSAIRLFNAGGRHIIGERFGDIVTDSCMFKSLVESKSSELVVGDRYLQALNTRISISAGEVTGSVIVMRDITELKVTQKKLNETTRALQEANAELQVLANTDGLTGIPNRRFFFEQFATALSRQERTGGELCLLILDLDHFKRINDRYGHSAGDAVLRRVANLLKNTTRKHDIVGRLGGEEFGVIFTDTDIEGASDFAGRLRIAIQNSHADGEVAVTASMGLTSAQADMAVTEIFDKADTALYRSKEEGRNRVTIG